MHVKEVSKLIKDQGIIKIIVDLFMGQASRWWEMHAPQLETCNTIRLYFFKIFMGEKLSTSLDIPTFIPGFDPICHIQQCEKEWKKTEY